VAAPVFHISPGKLGRQKIYEDGLPGQGDVEFQILCQFMYGILYTYNFQYNEKINGDTR